MGSGHELSRPVHQDRNYHTGPASQLIWPDRLGWETPIGWTHRESWCRPGANPASFYVGGRIGTAMVEPAGTQNPAILFSTR